MDGIFVGFPVGNLLTTRLGWRLGVSVTPETAGLVVGGPISTVGVQVSSKSVGRMVGSDEGSSTGTSEGSLVGNSEGSLEGNSERLIEGTLVGERVRGHGEPK